MKGLCRLRSFFQIDDLSSDANKFAIGIGLLMSEYARNNKKRMSGILAHPTSFPSPYGIGDMGQCSYDFIDFLVSSGQTLWQVLPLGPTGYGDSPYQSFSSFAGQTLIISPDLLLEDGLLAKEDLYDIPVWYSDTVDYGYVIHYKNGLYKKAYSNFLLLQEQDLIITQYNDFCLQQESWLSDYTLYTAVKEARNGESWLKWPDALRVPTPDVKEAYANKLEDTVNYHKFLQFIFYRQWNGLKQYANDRNVFIVGDIPIFVALDGSDTWANQDLFCLDANGFPTEVSGVPPDYFSETGQLWGNPLYDWNVLKKQHYKWWIDRIEHQLDLVDYLRIDHFRGFEAYWSVPFGEKTAVNGNWKKGPGFDFFHMLREALGNDLPIFAEDLGVITPEVEKLRDDFNLPGMKVLQFAFEDTGDNHFLPYNYPFNCLCYTGTHDNDTTAGWYRSARPECRERAKLYMNSDCSDAAWDFIRLALGSTANYAIIPIQDILSIGTEGRMNTPGNPSGNWNWRFTKESLTNKIANKLRTLTQLYGR